MKATPLAIAGPLLIEPQVFEDERGFFLETFNRREFQRLAGIDADFAQDNLSGSRKHVLRGLHYQVRQTQGKLVEVVNGEIFDVVLDLRRSSPTFGRWDAHRLLAADRRMLWIPPGFAHGFLALTDSVEVAYKTTDYWAPEFERCILWNDPDLAIDWPLAGAEPILSRKDRQATLFRDAEVFP